MFRNRKVLAIFLSFALLGGFAAADAKTVTIKVESAVFTDGPGVAASVNNFIVVGNITEVNGKPAQGWFFLQRC